MERRDALKLMGVMAATSTFSFACTDEEVDGARARAAEIGSAGTTQPDADYTPQFFTEHEYETVHVLADLIIPADDRSGSASDAGVPAFIDFIMTDELIRGMERRQTAMRGGLAWLDYQCLERFGGKHFVACTDAERRELLEVVAYPDQAPSGMEPGVRFFNSFRDLTAAGFFSSKMGMEDIGYMGNSALPEWTGCPENVLEHMGLR